MTILIISIPDSEAKLFTELVRKFNGEILSEEKFSEPNSLTLKALDDAHNRKNLSKPIEDVRSFINSLGCSN